MEDILAGRDDREPFSNVSGTGWLARRTADAAQQLRADGNREISYMRTTNGGEENFLAAVLHRWSGGGIG